MRRLALMALAVLNLITFGVVVLSIQQVHQAAVAAAQAHTANLATAVENDMAGLLARIDLALLSVGDELSRQSAFDQPAFGREAARKLDAFMTRHATRLPETVGLRFADADGWLNFGSGAERMNVADLDHFRQARAGATAGLIVGKPMRTRIAPQWVMPVARRLEDKHGAFAGIVCALVSLDRLAAQFARMEVGKHGGVALRDGEMGLVVRVPELEGVGAQIGDRTISQTAKDLAAAKTHTATYATTTPADGRVRMVSIHRVAEQPLYVAVTLAEEEYLATWRGQAARAAGLAFVVMLLSLFVGGLMVRSWRRGLAEVAMIVESRQLLQTVAENTHDWVYWRSADRRSFHYLSPACELITGYPPADFEADPDLLDRIVHPDDRARWEAHLRDKADNLFHASEEYRILTRRGGLRWISHSCREIIAPDGTRLGRCGTNQDITAHKLAAETLRRQLDGFRTLNAVAALRAASHREMLHRVLDIGAKFLGLEFGIVSQVRDDIYTVVAQVSPPGTLEDGQTFPFGVTYCSITLAQDGVVAIDDMGHSTQVGHPCYQTFKLETYIGVPVVVAGEVYGTVNFSSPRPYPRVFDDGDREFITLMARWVGAVIEREQARRRLVGSEAHLRAIVDNEPECVKLVAPDGTLLQMNPAGLAMVEAEFPEQVIGRSVLGLIAPDYRKAFLDLHEKVCVGGSGTLEFEIVGLKGGRRWLETQAVPMRDADGNITGQLAVTRDISRRKAAEDRLFENMRRTRALIDAGGESMLLLDPDGKLLAINQAGARRFARTPEQMVGTNFFDHLPADLAAKRREALRMATETGESLRMHDQRGQTHFDNTLHPVKNDAGVVEAIAIYAKDVTERRRDEQTEALFHQADAMLLRWQMNAPTIAQMVCDGLLPLFDLGAAWVGRAEKSGELRMLAVAAREDGATASFAAHVRKECRRWQDGVGECLPAEKVMMSGHPCVFDIAGGDCAGCVGVSCAAGIAAAMMIPLTLRGETWGVLALYGDDVRQFEAPEISARLTSIAGRFATALEAALQQEWLTLLETALATTSNAAFITDVGGRILWINHAFIALSGFAEDELIGATPKLFKSGAHDEAFYRGFWATLQAGETWQGEIVNARRDGSRYTVNQTVTPLRDAAGGIGHYVSILEDITARKADEARIEHLANFDVLTDLPNRNLFFDRLGQTLALARRDGHVCALLFLDLDRFKEVNDTFGHEAGDLLLKTVAARCLEVVRESDTVARLAGDEFTVLLPRIAGADDAARVAEKIIAALGRPVDIGGREAEIGVSIGIALFPSQADTIETLLGAADHAMYAAKRAGRNTWRFHDAGEK